MKIVRKVHWPADDVWQQYPGFYKIYNVVIILHFLIRIFGSYIPEEKSLLDGNNDIEEKEDEEFENMLK